MQWVPRRENTVLAYLPLWMKGRNPPIEPPNIRGTRADWREAKETLLMCANALASHYKVSGSADDAKRLDNVILAVAICDRHLIH